MKKKYRLEPFDIERAKNGEPVCTIDGHDARIVCWDCKQDDTDTIVALVTLNNGLERPEVYELNGSSYEGDKPWYDLVMKVAEPTIFAKVDGEIIPFEDAKRVLEENNIILNSLIIKTYDGKFLEIWKGNFEYYDWEKAQEAASKIGDGWRCPTRHEWIDIYDAYYNGLDKALLEIEGDMMGSDYWTCEAYQHSPAKATYFNFFEGGMHSIDKGQYYGVRPVKLIESKEE